MAIEVMTFRRFDLPFGRAGRFECDLEVERVLAAVEPPRPVQDVPRAVAEALESPLDFPPLTKAVVEGDRVAIVLDRDTPEGEELVAGLWNVLSACGVKAEDVLIIQPADVRGHAQRDPRRELPEDVQSLVRWKLHDPVDETGCGYLATSAAGERVYLTRDLLEADLVLCVGPISFDATLGYRGTQSALYPGLSNAETIRKTLGAAHSELEPDDPRPLRELADEVGWLLGVQFVVQVIPAAGGGIESVIAGLAEPVLAEGKRRLAEAWRVDVGARPELVVASVDADAGGHGWSQVAAALDTARRIVARDGRILLLTELAEEPSAGIEMIRDARTPREALKPVRERAQADREEALQVAQALDRANVYLLSKLPDDVVEGLFMVPVADVQEARRVIEGTEECAVVGSAQHAYVRYAKEDS